MDFKERFKGKMAKVDKSGVQDVLLKNVDCQGIERSNIMQRPQSDQPSSFVKKTNQDLHGNNLNLKIGSTRLDQYTQGPDTNYSVKSAQVNGVMGTPNSNNYRNYGGERFSFSKNNLNGLNNNKNNGMDSNNRYNNGIDSGYPSNHNMSNYYVDSNANSEYLHLPGNQLQRSRSDQQSYRKQDINYKSIDLNARKHQLPDINQSSQLLRQNSGQSSKKGNLKAQSDRKFNKDNLSNNSMIQNPTQPTKKKQIKLANSNIIIKQANPISLRKKSGQNLSLNSGRMETEGDASPLQKKPKRQNTMVSQSQNNPLNKKQPQKERKSLEQQQMQQLMDQDSYINKITEQCYKDMKDIQSKKQYFNGNKKYQLYHSSGSINHNNANTMPSQESTPMNSKQEGYMQYFMGEGKQGGMGMGNNVGGNNLLRQYQSYVHKTPDWSQIGGNFQGNNQHNNTNSNNSDNSNNFKSMNLVNSKVGSNVNKGFRAKDLDANYSAIHRNAKYILDSGPHNQSQQLPHQQQ